MVYQMNGIHSNSFIHFDEICVDLVQNLSFLRRNFVPDQEISKSLPI